jgi:hypothetical protein
MESNAGTVGVETIASETRSHLTADVAASPAAGGGTAAPTPHAPHAPHAPAMDVPVGGYSGHTIQVQRGASNFGTEHAVAAEVEAASVLTGMLSAANSSENSRRSARSPPCA